MKPDPRGIFFNSKYLGEPQLEYVCWLDVMGTANQMLRSVPIAANFIFKLHCAVLEAYDELEPELGVRLYPVMDGVYVTACRRQPLQLLLNQTLQRVVTTFLSEAKCYHQFLVRGAIAYGPVYHGLRLDERTADVLAVHEDVRNSILVGLPMAQAYRAESDAPPFGIAAHSSARAFSPEGDTPFRFPWLDWFHSGRPPVDTNELLKRLLQYFEWQKAHYNMTGYEPSRIEHHRTLAVEYFPAGD